MPENGRMVTVFGGAKCAEGAQEYVEAYRLGRQLAEAGFTVCTGGYLGVMEAASKGASEACGRVLGITMSQFNSAPNRFLTDQVAAEHFYERLQNLITKSVGFVALRGGMGTVTEISLVWNKLTTKVLSPRPLVLVGECWRGVVEAWQTHLVVSDEDVRMLHFASDAADAVDHIIKNAARVR